MSEFARLFAEPTFSDARHRPVAGNQHDTVFFLKEETFIAAHSFHFIISLHIVYHRALQCGNRANSAPM
jgi:hypothetical protein